MIINHDKVLQSIINQSCISDWYINTQLRVSEVNENRTYQTMRAITNKVLRQTKRTTNMNREFDQYRKLDQT